MTGVQTCALPILKTTASKEGKERLKTMTPQQLKDYDKKKQEEKEKKEAEFKKMLDKKKADFKKLSTEEKENILLKMRLNKEFIYINDAIKDKNVMRHLQEQLKDGKIIVGDPGCRAPITLLGEKGSFNYRNRRRISETKRLKYTRLRQNKYNKILKETQSEKANEKLKEGNKKTMRVEEFEKYIRIKFQLMNKIGAKELGLYSNTMNQLKWYSYINKQRHEDGILNEIESKYGSDATIVIGDWSQKDHIKGLSSPNMGIKRLLKKRFEVYLIDEYKTSKINHITKEEMKYLKMPIKYTNKSGEEKEYVKEIYSVFTYQTSKRTTGCINRDYNATLNMKIIVESIIKGKGRPKEYCRGRVKVTKSSNPLKKGQILECSKS